MNFDVPEKAELHRTHGGLARNPPLPGNLRNWTAPDFDDVSWKKGRAPIGTGLFKWKNSPATFKNQSEWGDGEFILARTAFDYDGSKHSAYRIRILAPRAYEIHLNGQAFHEYVWWKNLPHYQPVILDQGQIGRLIKGVNHLSIYANRTDRRGPAQVDAVIEGLDLKGLAP